MKKVVFLMSVMLVASAAWADDFTYIGTGNWSNEANWDGGVVPTIFDRAAIGSGQTLTIDSGNWVAAGVRVGGWKWDWSGQNTPVTFNMSGGTLNVGGEGFGAGYGPCDAYVNFSGGTLTATAGWGRFGDNGNVYWNQTGGEVKMWNNGLGNADPGSESNLHFNITGGEFYMTYHPVNFGAGSMIMQVGGTGIAKLDDVGLGAGATGTVAYILDPGGVIKVSNENLKLLPYLTAPGGYTVSTEPGYTVYTGVPEPITLTLLGLGGLLIRRRG